MPPVGGTTHYDPGDGGAGAIRVVNRDGTALTAGGGGGVSIVDDAAFTDGASSLTVAGGVVTSDSVDSGDAGAFKMLANRQQVVSIADSDGNVLNSFGGGTQYTEDAAAAANPVGNALILVRADTPAGRTTTDGDNVAATATDKGELYVKHVDAIPINDGGNTITVDGTVAVTNAGLTELAAAINGSSQMDVNLAASNATVTVSNAPLSNAHSADYDSGGGTDTTTAFGIAVPASGGAAVITGDASNGLDVDVTRVSGTVTVDGSGVTQPVSNSGLTELAAAINSSKVDVNVVTSDVSFGGGTEYTEGDTDASITGTAMLWEDAGNTLATISAGSPLPVEIVAGAGSGGTAAADDADFTAGTTSGTPAMGVYESSPSSVTDGDLGTVGITQTRALRTAVEGSVAVTNAGLTEVAAAINGSSQMDVNIAANGVGLATSAKQDTVIGHLDGVETVLGTIDADTGSILTAVQLLDDAVAVLGTDTYTETTTKGLTIGAVRRDADTTLVNTTNEIGPLQMDANGRLKVEAFSGETLPVSLASVPSHAVTVASGGIASGAVASGAYASGAFASGSVASGAFASGALATGAIADMLVDDAAFTPGTSRVMPMGLQADETATDSVNEGDVGAPRMTLDRKQIVTLQPHAAGGLSTFSSIDLDETEEEVKGSAGQVYSIIAFNRTAAPLYLKLYDNTAAGTSVGSTTPLATYVVPANADSDGAGMVISGAYGIACATGITVAATTGVAVADTGAPGANDCVVVVNYV